MSLPPFQHLVDEHWRDVARLAHALAPGHGDDVAQQAWTQALAAYPRLTHARNLRSWLLTITHRCAMDHHRAGPAHDTARGPVAARAGPRAPAARGCPTATCGRGSAPCRERQRDAVVLRFVGDLDHRAVAAALGTSPGMSRRLVSDAHRHPPPRPQGPAMTNPFTTFDPPLAGPPVLAPTDVSYVLEDTPVGRLLLAVTADGRGRDLRLRPRHRRRGPLARRGSRRRVSPRVLRHPAADGCRAPGARRLPLGGRAVGRRAARPRAGLALPARGAHRARGRRRLRRAHDVRAARVGRRAPRGRAGRRHGARRRTRCASCCPATGCCPPPAGSAGMPVGRPPRSTSWRSRRPTPTGVS